MADKHDIVVVGAGAAGIFASLRAAEMGAKVLLLEKTSRIGTKILISGGGKCNVAHAGPLESVIAAFRPEEARFIRPACYQLTNEKIVELMTSRGLRVYTRPDGRVFPVDQTAKDVVAILTSYLEEAGVDIRLNSPVEEIYAVEGKISGVKVGSAYQPHAGYRPSTEPRFGAKALLANVIAESEPASGAREPYEIRCKKLILCTGGSSYPNSGTTGDGWPWAKSLGHTLVRIRAALAPIYLKAPDTELSGLALRDCTLRARQDRKEVAKWTGDLLLTHQGISGPTCLGISRRVAEVSEQGPVLLEVDVIPSHSAEEISAQLLDLSQSHPKRLVSGFVETLAPQRFAVEIMRCASVPMDTPFSRLDKKSRNRLATVLKAFPLGEARHVPIEKGEVCAGGINLNEVESKTMRSKLVDGLYLCGEILDVAGPVGGYNLQAAFATGYLAGQSAASDFTAL